MYLNTWSHILIVAKGDEHIDKRIETDDTVLQRHQ